MHCKRNGLIPHFAVKINKYLRVKIGSQILDAEIRNEHCKKKKLLKQVRNIHLDQESQDELKSKIRRTCKNYSKIKIPYQQQKVMNNLSNNKNIILIKRDKGRGIIIFDRKHYIEKCFSIVDSEQFKKLKKDPKETLEFKVERTLQKIKNVLSEKDYKKIYPTGLRSGLFYGTAKVHKLQGNQGLNQYDQ